MTKYFCSTVDEEITDGRCVISGNFTAESAVELANQINGGALPFELVTQSYNAISQPSVWVQKMPW